MDDMQQFKETYITECRELLEDMEEKLLALDEQNPDIDDLNAIFRCAHSIKGGSGAFGFDRITKFTHILEELLDAMREGEMNASRDVIDALLASVDIVSDLVSAAQQGVDAAAGIEDTVSRQLSDVMKSEGMDVGGGSENSKEEEQGADEISVLDIKFVPYKNVFLSGNEPVLIIKELISLGEVDCLIDIENVPTIDKLDHESCYVSWSISLETDSRLSEIDEVFEFVEGDCDLQIIQVAAFAKEIIAPPVEEDKEAEEASSTKQQIPEKEAPKQADNKSKKTEADASVPAVSSIRVDIDKVDRLVNMVGELVITQAMIAAQAEGINFEDHPQLILGINTLSQHTRELQESVMAVRMQPVKSVFSRMPRIVRDLSSQLGKSIKMETRGEATELDKTVIEQLSDPLTHMIRNSVDHGISGPEDRVAKGKNAQGTITLSAEHSGGKIVLKIEDDGEGINREKVLQKAKDKGLVADGADMSDQEIDNLIFMAGFSTADVVSNISGRGVGMDVVRKNIEALGGNIRLINKPGEGSSFIVLLPLTLAILDGMIVRVGEEKYIIPIVSIIETMRPTSEDVRKIADANDLINVRGEFVSIAYLHRVFDIPNAEHDPAKALVVLVENGHDKFGLVVDELIGQQQVVIKSMEENSDAVEGISAATILGDGKVALILDITKLQNLVPEAQTEEAL